MRNLLLLVLALALSPCLRAQQQQPTTVIPSPPAPPTNGTEDQAHHIVARTDMVVLHATVTDAKGNFVSDLQKDNFRVFENKIEQKISVFQRADIPVTMGLVIDNSGSMREKRAQVNAAAMTFVKTSNPQDEVFVVNFNDEYYLDINEDFTNNQQELQEALDRIDSRGSTALYDALIGSLDHLKKGHKDKRVLLVITDGDDDASRESFEYTIKAAEQSDAAIYCIGVFSDDDRKNDKRMVRHSKKVLTELAEATGGMAYYPDSLDQVNPVCEQVARDIRNQYTLGYYPTNTAKDGSFRAVQVQLLAPHNYGKLYVRTRTGYYAQRATTAQGL
jgi:Ca-activated chloride channel homolog